VGSGDRIALLALPFLIVGGLLNWAYPELFSVGGPPNGLRTASFLVLIPGVIIWLWSALLIVTKVPRGELITSGPFSLVRHPLYTDVALLVLPWVGFLLDTWLGAVLGIVVYLGCRRYAPLEEDLLARKFGRRWDAYVDSVRLPWL
jgi:protein-S-isoprenylcysteine O-methyltransferase Ste14